MNFNIYNSIMLAGIIQGFIFGLVVALSKKYRTTGTLLLAAFILSFSFDNFQYYLEDVGAISEKQLMEVFFIPFQLLSGPLFLLYGMSLLDPERRIHRRAKWLFVPFALAILVSSAYKFSIAIGPNDQTLLNLATGIESTIEYVSIVVDLSILIFLLSAVRKHEQQMLPDSRLAWFKIVLITLFVLSGLWIYIAIQDYFYDTAYWYVLYIGMAAVVYWMGHVGIYKFGIEQERKKTKNKHYQPLKQKNEHIAALEKLLITEKRFLNPTLTLDAVAAELNLSKSHLSRLINAELHVGFPDYLNALRVEEAKANLVNPEFANYTLLAIGLEAGFNSKTTFNTAFKKATAQTPSEYRCSSEN